MIKTCPLEPEYKFKTRCKITTCKNYTPRTQNRCLGLDFKHTAVDDYNISDAELLHYKFPDKEMSVKDVTRIRKSIVTRITRWTQLYAIISHITTTCAERRLRETQLIAEMADTKPFNVGLFKFKSWMFLYLVDEEFCRDIVPSFNLRAHFKVTSKAFDTFVTEVKESEIIPSTTVRG